MLQWLFLYMLDISYSVTNTGIASFTLGKQFVLHTTQNTQHNNLLKIKHTLCSEFTNLGTWSGHYPDLLSDLNCQNRLATNLATFSGVRGNVGVDTNTFYRESDVKACHTGTVHVLNEHWGLLQALPLLDCKHSRGRSWHGSAASSLQPQQIHTTLNESSPTTLCLFIKFDIF